MYNNNQYMIDNLNRQKDRIDDMIRNYQQPQPVNNFINTNQNINKDFIEWRILNENEEVDNLYVQNNTLFINDELMIKKSVDGSLEKWKIKKIYPIDKKDEKINSLENKIKELEAKLNEYSKPDGAILKWIMEGSKRVIDNEYHLTKPAVVENAINKYKESNDWFSQFLDECCEVDNSFSENSGEVYSAYRDYCSRVGDYIRSTTDFYTALESAGFQRRKTKTARLIYGLKLKSEFLEN